MRIFGRWRRVRAESMIDAEDKRMGSVGLPKGV